MINAPIMSATEIMLWSATTGTLAMVVLMGLVDAALSRALAAWQLLWYLTGSALVAILLGGLPANLWPEARAGLQLAEVLLGPLCAAVGSYGVSQWLYADRRDRTIRITLMVMTVSSLAGGPLCLLLAPASHLPASAALCVTTMALALWLAVRAAQRGDSMAWGLASGCLLALPALVGLYYIALDSISRPALGLQAVIAFAALASTTVTGLMIWRRNRQIRLLYKGRRSDRDPASGLFSSLTMLQKIIASQLNRRKNGSNGALMAVMLFEPESVLVRIGHSGLNELYTELALRMRRQTGIINPAGRYYDRCFLVLFETMHSPRWLATLSLRTAASLRYPVELTSLSGERLWIRADVGVGIIHVAKGVKNVDELVHEAQAIATAARHMPLRAALFDPLTRQAVAAESADLGSRWEPMRRASESAPTNPSTTSPQVKRERPA